jgi:flagellar basal body-associated protein FliL
MMSDALHPLAAHHLPLFITPPGETDVLMVVMIVFIIGIILVVGNLYLRLHSLPERMAHRAHKLQFEIVAVLALLALFTHNHLYWVAALLLALVRIPDFWTPLTTMAEAQEKIARHLAPVTEPAEAQERTAPRVVPATEPEERFTATRQKAQV